MKLKTMSVAIAALFAAAGSISVSAQQAPAAGSTAAKADDSEKLEKITVTARRREESLQDVPVSVTAFTADTLSKNGVPDITAVAQSVPNTTLTASRGTNSTLTAFIRGVGQQDPVAGFESGVGIYLDDIYLARPQGAVADIYDVQRVEVLRGPQGTLYGRNTIGGAVKYVTRKLGPEADVRLKATFGNYRQADIVATGSAPLSDGVRVGGTIARFGRDGFGTNLANGDQNYNKDILAGRLSLEMTPTAQLFVRFAGDATRDESNPRHGHRLTPEATSGAPVLSNVFDSRANLTTVLGRKQQVSQGGGSALFEYQINDTLLLKSITAKRRDTSYAPIDFDALNKPTFDVPALYKNKQFSQEFQLTYTGKNMQGVAGVYYIDANAYNKFDVRLLGTSTFTEDDVDTKAWAVFADASFDVTDRFSFSVGGRYTEDQRKASVLRQIYLGVAGSPGMGNPGATLFRTDTNLTNGELDKTDKKFTPKLSASWKASDTQNIYASIAQGFKGGSFDPRLNLVGTRLTVAQAKKGFEPEVITTVELGLKSQFNGGRILTNAAVFHSDYKDVQIPGSVAIDTNGDGIDDSFAGVTTNAGKAKIKGIELEATARFTDNFSMSGMLGYIDAKYTKFVGAGNIDVSSQRGFQNTPKKTANIRATYEWPSALMGRGGKFSLSSDVAYRSDTQQFEFAVPILDQKAFSLWNASLVWSSADNKLRLGLHGKNLNDKLYKIAGYNFPTLPSVADSSVLAFYGNPRTVSATIEYRF
ncbi:MAG: TonB-dependent receptor [Betaproteobacteria bacterium]|nr:TonB-dependent receptor [Betaproteobacteria bacterium]